MFLGFPFSVLLCDLGSKRGRAFCYCLFDLFQKLWIWASRDFVAEGVWGGVGEGVINNQRASAERGKGQGLRFGWGGEKGEGTC